MEKDNQTMKLNRIMAALITAMGTQAITLPAARADQIIQKPYGAFYIVSDQEAKALFDRNNFGFFALPPSVSAPVHSVPVKAKKSNRKKPAPKKSVVCPPANCPVTPLKPVTTVEPAESIFLRLEKK